MPRANYRFVRPESCATCRHVRTLQHVSGYFCAVDGDDTGYSAAGMHEAARSWRAANEIMPNAVCDAYQKAKSP